MSEPSILDEAKAVLADRRARVDDPQGNFARIAAIWSVVFGHPVTPKQVALAMIGVKLGRECYRPWRDNLVDLAGYAQCADELDRREETRNEPTEAEHVAATAGGDGQGGRVDEERPRDAGEGNCVGTFNPNHPYGKAWGTHDSGP